VDVLAGCPIHELETDPNNTTAHHAAIHVVGSPWC